MFDLILWGFINHKPRLTRLLSIRKALKSGRKTTLCDMYGALQGAVSCKYAVFCIVSRAYGALQGAVRCRKVSSSYGLSSTSQASCSASETLGGAHSKVPRGL